MTINIQQVGAWFLRLLAIAGVVVAAIDPNNLPASYRNVLTVVSAVILAVDRYLADPSTGTTNAPTPHVTVNVPGAVPSLPPTGPQV